MTNILFLIANTSLCLLGVKLLCEKGDNISNKIYAKLRKYLSKKKELDQIVLQTVLSKQGTFV